MTRSYTQYLGLSRGEKPSVNFFALPVKFGVKSNYVKRKINIVPILLLLFLASGTLAFGYTKAKNWLSRQNTKTLPKKLIFINEPAVLGSFLTDTLPAVKKDGFSSPSAQPTAAAKPLGENLAQETEKIVREFIDSVTATTKEAVANNVTINQEKIVQDITAKLLQSLLTQTSTVGQPVDRAVYEACVNIIKKESPTLTPACSP